MKFKRYLGNFNHFITHIFVLATSILTMLPFVAYANENNYQITEVAQLEHKLISQPSWQQIIVNPSNKRQHFVIRESGQIYLVDDDEINPQAILDMSAYQQTDSSLFKLTAIELHPNFSLRDQVGYGTFYTAHIENINKNSKTKRLQAHANDLQLNFDAVITEWQFSAVNHQKIDDKTKREVLRVAVPDSLMMIQQISFSPHIKSWNDDFGLLYVALNGQNKWPQPLYSGVILRINPTKFGLRSFTVPNNNPYLKNSQINDAIYLLGGQKIEQFIWPDKNSEHLLVSHQYNNKYFLSLTNGRDDWRDSAGKGVLYQSDDAVHDVLMYQGRQLPLLRSKLLLLRKKEQHWLVDSLAFNLSDNQNVRDENKPQLEWQFTPEQLPTNSQISFSSNSYGEIFFLEKAEGVLLMLTQEALVDEKLVVDTVDPNTVETSSPGNSIFTVLITLALFGSIYYWFKGNSHSAKAIVRQHFAYLELSKSGQQIGLYYRNQRKTETIIDIVDIVSSEIKLNDQSINVINTQLGHGFNNEQEQGLRTIFANEQVDKMVDGKIRQVSLLLTDNQKHSYTVCLYMRKGSNRITKKAYSKVIDDLIDWCWLIGEKINADETEIRKVKSIAFPQNKAEAKHHQAAAIIPVIHEMDNASQSLPTDDISPTLKIVNENEHQAENEDISEVHNLGQQKSNIDTELVNALEKLVSLKQQGFLTMDEFTKAKEKLLKDLFDK